MPRGGGGARGAAIGIVVATAFLAVFPAHVAAPDYPYVLQTDPANGAYDVPVYLPVIVRFSHAMNRSLLVRSQPEVAFESWWLNSDYTLMLVHAADFAPCTTYWLFVDGADKGGLNLQGNETRGVPDPWTFSTPCSVFAITRTYPLNNQTWLPTQYDPFAAIWFSQPVDPATFQAGLVPFVPFNAAWSNGNRQVALGLGGLLDCTWYMITVSARDTLGRALTNVTGTPPNPWRFRTPCFLPRIMAVDPPDGATGVDLAAPIVVTFSNSMNRSTVWSYVSPVPALPFNASWASDDTVLTLAHAWPFNRSTTYTVWMGGWDTGGVQLVQGPVPIPWSFTTGALPAPSGLHVARTPPDITLTWESVPGASQYAVYASSDKFEPWPWTLLGTTAMNRFVHVGADGDGATHFYVVRAVDGSGGEGANSTMGMKLLFPFVFDPSRTSVHMLSLPYRTEYRTARDVSDALTSAKIDVVGKWNSTTQSFMPWSYVRGAWRGVDFPIRPGDGIYVDVRASFTWVVNGTDSATSLRFWFNLPPRENVEWFGLPCSSAYARASDLVLAIEGSTGPSSGTWVREVGRWDAARQTTVVFRYASTGWTGTDFAVAPGDGLYFRIAADFRWTPRLVVPEVP